MKATGMKCKCATEPSSPAYTTVVNSTSAHTSHSLPSLYLDSNPPESASWKQVIRPFLLLAPNPPRKYPCVVRSPTLGLATGATTSAGATTAAAGVTAAGCSACASSVGCWASAFVGSSAKAGVDRKPVTNNPDSPDNCNARRMIDLSLVCYSRQNSVLKKR